MEVAISSLRNELNDAFIVMTLCGTVLGFRVGSLSDVRGEFKQLYQHYQDSQSIATLRVLRLQVIRYVLLVLSVLLFVWVLTVPIKIADIYHELSTKRAVLTIAVGDMLAADAALMRSGQAMVALLLVFLVCLEIAVNIVSEDTHEVEARDRTDTHWLTCRGGWGGEQRALWQERAANISRILKEQRVSTEELGAWEKEWDSWRLLVDEYRARYWKR